MQNVAFQLGFEIVATMSDATEERACTGIRLIERI